MQMFWSTQAGSVALLVDSDQVKMTLRLGGGGMSHCLSSANCWTTRIKRRLWFAFCYASNLPS
jgi:hypothetical protein